MGEVDD